jgi:hypothetical protein
MLDMWKVWTYCTQLSRNIASRKSKGKLSEHKAKEAQEKKQLALKTAL